MPNQTGPWYNRQQKRQAIVDFMRYIWEHRDEADTYVGSGAGDGKAVKKFNETGAASGVTVPTNEGARLVILQSGEKDLQAGSSVVIELPPRGWPADGKKPTDKQLLRFVIGNYVHW